TLLRKARHRRRFRHGSGGGGELFAVESPVSLQLVLKRRAVGASFVFFTQPGAARSDQPRSGFMRLLPNRAPLRFHAVHGDAAEKFWIEVGGLLGHDFV